jgi:hypothetical protein
MSVADNTHDMSVADNTHDMSAADNTHDMSIADNTHDMSASDNENDPVATINSYWRPVVDSDTKEYEICVLSLDSAVAPVIQSKSITALAKLQAKPVSWDGDDGVTTLWFHVAPDATTPNSFASFMYNEANGENKNLYGEIYVAATKANYELLDFPSSVLEIITGVYGEWRDDTSQTTR